VGVKMKKVYTWILLSMLMVAIATVGTACTTEDAVGAGLTGFWIFCAVIGGLVGLFLFVLWIICIVDAAKRKNNEFPGGGDNLKTIWLVILIVSFVVGFGLSGIAAIVYYFMVMKKMPRKK